MKNKKLIIPMLMFTITIILIICIFLSKDNSYNENFQYNGTWRKTINNYYNNKLYSTTTIRYILRNGKYTYQKITTYQEDPNIKVTTKKTGTYEEENNTIKIASSTFYINNEKLCIESPKCQEPFSEDQELIYTKKYDNFNPELYLKETRNIIREKNPQIYVIINKGCPNCEKYKKTLNILVHDYNVTINLIDISKVSKSVKSTIIDDLKISQVPATLIMNEEKIIYKQTGNINLETIEKVLEKNDYESR